MEELNHKKLIVKQKVEGLEILTGIESSNKYQILTENEKELFFAYEESNFLARIILKKMRPLKVFIKKNNEIVNNENGENSNDSNNNNKTGFLRIEKKFAFFWPEFEVFDSQNLLIAKIKTKFGFTSKFEIFDKNNRLQFYCKNKIGSPWTFNIYKTKVEENPIGVISKKWSGIGKEIFTDSDNFKIDFKEISQINDKKIILGLSLIIDLYAFEK